MALRVSKMASRWQILAVLALTGEAGGAGLIQLEDQSASVADVYRHGESTALKLNSFIFDGNVLRVTPRPDSVHWVVNFCPSWWEPCQGIAEPFERLAAEWQQRLNHDLLTSQVRFAVVDCATDKVLCNEQEVDAYPTVAHYMGGTKVAQFAGGGKNDGQKLAKWLTKQFGGVHNSGGSESEAEPEAEGSDDSERAADILLAILGLVASVRLVLSNPALRSKDEKPKESSAPERDQVVQMASLLPQEWVKQRASIVL